MTFADLQRANGELKNMEIKGKAYTPVNERIKAFRMIYPEGGIATEIIHIDDNKVIIKATVTDQDGRTLATGHAYEVNGSTSINKLSFIENCETSAIGRALGALGIGIDKAVKSYEEQQTVDQLNDKITADESASLDMQLSDNQKSWIYKRYGVKKLADLNRNQYIGIIKSLESRQREDQSA